VSAFDFIEHCSAPRRAADNRSTRLPFVELMNEIGAC
jgi:hypothetical protein